MDFLRTMSGNRNREDGFSADISAKRTYFGIRKRLRSLAAEYMVGENINQIRVHGMNDTQFFEVMPAPLTTTNTLDG